ncbi:MAG: 2-oxoacid:acceptor oxidoreductase family protein [Candidatus Omnitrophota bacterium]|nr:2-oxoacid:acceptor oxidoreductase family protein [Candidatus Omnitrophota bacterium]
MKNTIHHTIICAGFGGQGIMVLGKVIAEAGMLAGMNVTWLPSYGAEVRGGTAHSAIRISSGKIASPIVSGTDTAIIMNGPSLDKFEKRIVPGGLLVLNTSMAERTSDRKDIEIANAPLTEEAIKLGNIRVANIIAVGIYLSKRNILTKDAAVEAIKKMGSGKKELVEINIKALELGMEIGK